MKNLTSKDILALFIVFLLLLSLGGYFLYQKITINKKIQQTKQQLQQIEQEIEKTKQFNEEEYAEKVTNLLNFENFISTSTDIQLEGVEIIDKGDRKLVINHAEGYQIEIPKELILNRSWNTDFLHFDNIYLLQKGAKPSDAEFVNIKVWHKEKSPEVFEEFNNDVKNKNFESEFNIKGITFYRNPTYPDLWEEQRLEQTAITGYVYTAFSDNKLYVIWIANREYLFDYINTFKLIKQ